MHIQFVYRYIYMYLYTFSNEQVSGQCDFFFFWKKCAVSSFSEGFIWLNQTDFVNDLLKELAHMSHSFLNPSKLAVLFVFKCSTQK